MTSKSTLEIIDRRTTLCLACSSSLPPTKSTTIFITDCCLRPICPSCIFSNPRLARYNPCLACLGGVDVVASGSATPKSGTISWNKTGSTPIVTNMNGDVRDEDTFIIGNDEDEDDEETSQVKHHHNYNQPLSTLGDTLDQKQLSLKSPTESTAAAEPSSSNLDGSERSSPHKYYLNQRDTLQGIALRFNLDSREICKLNNLPPSTMSTNPHLLHTRSFILLPSTIKAHPFLTMNPEESKEREDKLVRERAEKTLQMLTKEVDFRVAKAYVALADDPEEQEAYNWKHKEMGVPAHDDPRLEALAVESYLDDQEWEEAERRAGRDVQVRGLPQFRLGVEKINSKS